MNHPSISVAMATYNGARFLPEQLASIAAQTLLPAELVVTDDGSSDNTVAIVRAFADTAPFPVRVHENPVNLGFRANFMHAMALCSSGLIALCDQDDVWMPYKLERAAAPFADPDVLLSYHESWLIDAAGARIALSHMLLLADRNPPSSTFPMRNPYGFAMMFRRDLLDFSDLWSGSVDNLRADLPMAHDQWVFFLASALGTVAFIQEPLAGYRQHGSNTYGYDRPATSARARFNAWMRVRSQDFAKFTVAAASRIAILEQILPRLDPVRRAHAVLAIERYRALVRHSRWRAGIYGDAGGRGADAQGADAQGAGAQGAGAQGADAQGADAQGAGARGRLRNWTALLRDGGYGNGSRWLFGRKAAITDLACLVLPRRLVDAVLPPVPLTPRASAPRATSSTADDADVSAATPGS